MGPYAQMSWATVAEVVWDEGVSYANDWCPHEKEVWPQTQTEHGVSRRQRPDWAASSL